MITKSQATFLDNHSDDLYGLWEVWWYFDKYSRSMPQVDRHIFLVELIRMGLVDVYWTNNREQRGAALTPDVAYEKATDPSNWLPPMEGFQGNLVYLKESHKGAMLREKDFPDL